VGGAVNGYLLNGNVPKRHGTGSNLLVPYQVFETADRPICIAAGNDRLWVKCAQALGRPEWATDERFSDGRKRATNREVLIPLIAEVVRTQTREHWIAALGKVGVPVAPVNNVAELAQSEQLAAMDMKRTLPGSGLSVMGLPLNFDGQRPHPHSDSPKLGQHNKEVFG
jgi:formyl-CoA transferase